jgi:arylsulfatase A-like enzyme
MKILLLCCFSLLCSLPATDLKKPNIILFLVDDMGWSDIACYGSEISTPNIDKLAGGGLRFTQCYNTSKCFPSRACLITGVYAQQCGMSRSHGKIVNAVYTGEVLRSAGYRTYWSGKHHSTQNPFNFGYDHYYGLRDGACNMFNPGKQRPGEAAPAQKRAKRNWCIDAKEYASYTPPKGFYTTDAFTDYALQYLEEGKGSDKPFFLYLSYTAPHDPLMAWPEDIAKYKGKYSAGYKAIRDARYKKQLELGLISKDVKLSELRGQWSKLSAEEKAVEERTMEVYAAMIDRVDQNIGRVLAKVKELGQEENTLVLFTSDNGASSEVVKNMGNKKNPVIGEMDNWKSLGAKWANVSNTPFKEFKNFTMEGGICTPLVAYWPARIKEKGSITKRPTHFIDFLATFVDITKAKYPTELRGQKITPLQGESFLRVLEGNDEKRQKPLFWQWRKGKAVRKGDWKLVSHGKWELYNIAKDRSELNDLSTKFPEITKELIKLYEAWEKDVNIKPSK